MNIIINLDELEVLKLTPDLYCILTCIYKTMKIPDFIDTESKLNELVVLGFLKKEEVIDEAEIKYNLTGKGLNIFEKTNDFTTFVEEYRALFPKGVKSGNETPIRGDKNGVIKKMTWFLMNYPEYSRETILGATKQYIQKMERNGYQYMTQADYFIQKTGGSKLAALCEEYSSKYAHIVESGEKRL